VLGTVKDRGWKTFFIFSFLFIDLKDIVFDYYVFKNVIFILFSNNDFDDFGFLI